MKGRLGFLAVMLLCVQGASANEWIVSEATGNKGSSGFSIGFAGDGSVMDAYIDLNYDSSSFTAQVSGMNGASCTVHPDGGVVRVITPIADKALSKSVMALCQVTLIGNSSKSGAKAALTSAASECSRGAEMNSACDLSSATAQK